MWPFGGRGGARGGFIGRRTGSEGRARRETISHLHLAAQRGARARERERDGDRERWRSREMEIERDGDGEREMEIERDGDRERVRDAAPRGSLRASRPPRQVQAARAEVQAARAWRTSVSPGGEGGATASPCATHSATHPHTRTHLPRTTAHYVTSVSRSASPFAVSSVSGWSYPRTRRCAASTS